MMALSLLWGCADSSLTGLEKETDVSVTVKVIQYEGNTGDVYIAPTGELSSMMGDTDQESAAVAEITSRFKIPVALPGGQANVGSSTEDATASATIEAPDVEVPAALETPPAAPETPTIETDVSFTIDLKDTDDKTKSFQWIPVDITAALKGKEVKFVFSDDCGELIVPDGSVTFGEDGNPSNHDQRFYFCGTDFEVGTAENNNFMASIFTAPGCIAKTVDIKF